MTGCDRAHSPFGGEITEDHGFFDLGHAAPSMTTAIFVRRTQSNDSLFFLSSSVGRLGIAATGAANQLSDQKRRLHSRSVLPNVIR